VAALVLGGSLWAAAPEAPDDRPRTAAVVAGLVGARDPLRAAAVAQAAQATGMFAEPAVEAVPRQVPKVVLTGVQDGEPILKGVAGKESEEETSYYDLLTLAHQFPAAAFARTARKDLEFPHLFNQPARYRGEVVHFDGRLNRLWRHEAPDRVREAGVEFVYEGWVFDKDVYGANPMCVVFTDLPPGLEVGKKMDVPVSFDGYFFKKYRYPSGEKTAKGGQVYRDSPLLVGHAPVLRDPPANDGEEGSHSQTMVAAFLGLLIGVMVVSVGLTWWYKHGDKKVRRRVNQSRDVTFEDLPPPLEPPPPPEPGPRYQDLL